jgi:hypothetical protein
VLEIAPSAGHLHLICALASRCVIQTWATLISLSYNDNILISKSIIRRIVLLGTCNWIRVAFLYIPSHVSQSTCGRQLSTCALLLALDSCNIYICIYVYIYMPMRIVYIFSLPRHCIRRYWHCFISL